MKGSIVRKRSEGYGFIKPVDGDKDVFFHASSLVDVAFDDLNEGDMVTFEIEEGPKGPAAANVQRAADDAAPVADDTSDDSAPVEEEVAEAPADEEAAA